MYATPCGDYSPDPANDIENINEGKGDSRAYRAYRSSGVRRGSYERRNSVGR